MILTPLEDSSISNSIFSQNQINEWLLPSSTEQRARPERPRSPLRCTGASQSSLLKKLPIVTSFKDYFFPALGLLTNTCSWRKQLFQSLEKLCFLVKAVSLCLCFVLFLTFYIQWLLFSRQQYHNRSGCGCICEMYYYRGHRPTSSVLHLL